MDLWVKYPVVSTTQEERELSRQTEAAGPLTAVTRDAHNTVKHSTVTGADVITQSTQRRSLNPFQETQNAS